MDVTHWIRNKVSRHGVRKLACVYQFSERFIVKVKLPIFRIVDVTVGFQDRCFKGAEDTQRRGQYLLQLIIFQASEKKWECKKIPIIV